MQSILRELPTLVPQELAAELNVLLISDSSEHAVALRDRMEDKGMNLMLRRVDPGFGARAYVRRSGLYGKTKPADLIFFDFTDPDTEKLSLLKSIGFGPKRASAPVILLTSAAGERCLERDGILDTYSTMFAPTDLGCFLSKMSQHRQRRFMRALNVMYQLGPILVRTPRLSTPLCRPVIARQPLAMTA